MQSFRVKMWGAVAVLVALVSVGFGASEIFTGQSDSSTAATVLAQGFNIWEQDITDPFADDGSGEMGNNPGGGGSGEIGNNSGRSGGGSGALTNPLASNSIEGFLMKILEILLIVAVPIVVLFIMYAGFLYVTAGGESEKIKKAHAALTWSIVGGVIVLGANLIFSIIEQTIQTL